MAVIGKAVADLTQREYPGEPLIVAGYSNAVMGYIPSERVLREGGYEAVDSLMYYGQPGPFVPGVERRVFDAVSSACDAGFTTAASRKGWGSMRSLPHKPLKNRPDPGRCPDSRRRISIKHAGCLFPDCEKSLLQAR